MSEKDRTGLIYVPDVPKPRPAHHNMSVLKALDALEDEIEKLTPGGTSGIDERASGLRQQLLNAAGAIRTQVYMAMARGEGRPR